MREKIIAEDIERIEDETVRRACTLLRNYNRRIDQYLADIAASICNVPAESLLKVTNKPQYAHARWFYWYTYRHMTGCGYDTIVSMMRPYRKYSLSMVEYAVGRMGYMISNEKIWTKRWGFMKIILEKVLNTNE